MAREWYRFFLNLFILTGSGNNPITLEELQLGPPNQPDLTELLIQINQNIAPQYEDQSGDFLATLDTAQLMSMMSRFENAEAAIQGAYLNPIVQTGTIANYNLDGSPTLGGVAYGTGPALAVSAAGSSGQVLTSAGAAAPTWATPTTGTVSSVSVVSANGLAGTVATATTTPAITLSTTITGLLKGNGTAISAAASGTDYAPATSGTSILYGNGAGGFSNVTIGTGVSFAAGTLSATGSGGTVTSVTGTAPVVSSGGTTPAISMPAATTSVNGYLTSTDWTTFNNKGSGTVTSVSGTAGRITSTGGAAPVIDLVSGIATPGTTGSVSLIPVVTIDTYGRVTSITTAANPQGTVTSVGATSPLSSTGGATPVISITSPLPVANGGTGASSFTANYSFWGNGTSAVQADAGFVRTGAAGRYLFGSPTDDGTSKVQVKGVAKFFDSSGSSYLSVNAGSINSNSALSFTSGAAQSLVMLAGDGTGIDGGGVQIGGGGSVGAGLFGGGFTAVAGSGSGAGSTGGECAFQGGDASGVGSAGGAITFVSGVGVASTGLINFSDTLGTTTATYAPATGKFTIPTLNLTNALSALYGGTGRTSLGTGVSTALGVNIGSAGAFVTFNGALGTPSSGTVTNLTGTASININGTVGATTPATGSFTTLTVSGNATVGAEMFRSTATGYLRIAGGSLASGGTILLWGESHATLPNVTQIGSATAGATVQTFGGSGTVITTVSSTGLSVTGTLTSSGTITATNADVILTAGGQIKVSSTSSASGTAVVHNANGYYYDLLSSRRYKENFRAIPNDRAALDRFLKLTPELFDLKNDLGDKDVINFIAEDAADAEKDGLLSLTNYNSDGAPQSLRDYGFSAYQQLVLQDHEARLAALQAEFQAYKAAHP